MKHQDLVDNIEGSYLKKNYLEAFLLQSAYIESLVKLFFDLNFSKYTSKNSSDKQDGDEGRRKLFLKTLNSHFDKTNIVEILRLLEASGLISKEQHNLLDKYRIKRNKVLHDIVFEMGAGTFESDLKGACDIGKIIVKSEEFVQMGTIVQKFEELFEKKAQEMQATQGKQEKPVAS